MFLEAFSHEVLTPWLQPTRSKLLGSSKKWKLNIIICRSSLSIYKNRPISVSCSGVVSLSAAWGGPRNFRPLPSGFPSPPRYTRCPLGLVGGSGPPPTLCALEMAIWALSSSTFCQYLGSRLSKF
jgi:hypothetical protein